MASISKLLALAVIFFSSMLVLTVAHPGETHDRLDILREMRARGKWALHQRDAMSTCEDTEEARESRERAVQRRADTAERLRRERGIEEVPFLHRRTLQQFKNWEKSTHQKSSSLNYNSSTPVSTLFGATPNCILAPDNANGPYFVFGERIRSNVTEGQPGIPLHLELRFIDINTCRPAPNILVDIWSCNATGVYSGVSAAGEGGLKSTFLRGVQQTNADGVVNFDTIFPGHYSGRATHEHIITHTGATLNANGTYSGGHVSHLSQLFFDTPLVNAVEATAPYNTNKIPRTSNDADLFTGYSATAAYDPFPEYIVLGDQLSHGIFAWAEIGINLSNNWDQYASWAAYLAADGGHDNPNFNMGVVGTPPNTHG